MGRAKGTKLSVHYMNPAVHPIEIEATSFHLLASGQNPNKSLYLDKKMRGAKPAAQRA